MLGTIPNALAAHVDRTPGRVGFALGRKLLPWSAIFDFRQGRRFSPPARHLAGNDRGSNPTWDLPLNVCSD